MAMGARHALHRRYLAAMDIPVWEKRAVSVPDSLAEYTPVSERTPGEAEFDFGNRSTEVESPSSRAAHPTTASMDWDTLERTVVECRLCGLDATRTQTVFGVGSRTAQWMFIGEAPGVEEDRQGEPFVGRAGQLLNAMLFAIGLQRADVYIANVLKCRPPKNRDPQPNEVACCEPYLIRQIELIQPRLIVALGRHAAHSLLKTEMPLSRLRGQRMTYHGIPLIVTYHPAYLLRSPVEKRKVWEDLCLAKKMVQAA